MRRVQDYRARRVRSEKKILKEQIDWLLDFINIPDINSIPTWEFIKHNLNISNFAFGLGLAPFSKTHYTKERREVLDTLEIRAWVKAHQLHLKSSLEAILKRRDELIGEPAEVIDEEDEETGDLIPYTPIKEYRLPFSACIDTDGERIRILPPESISPEEDRSLLYHRTVELLSNLSLSRIRTCENKGCKRYFFQPTEKEKRYCSPKCTYQASTRRYREKYSERSRRSARRASRKRYEKKVRESSGPNVKIQKRART